MPRNVEIKARIEEPERLAAKAAALATAGPEELIQHDVFFHCRSGRLKLRRSADGAGELIAYRRADTPGPEASHYSLAPCADPAPLLAALTASLGVLGEVRKRRTLWLAGRTRIHLDEVAALGHFVELEVVLAAGESIAAGEAEAQAMMTALGIAESALESRAYLDLLTARGA